MIIQEAMWLDFLSNAEGAADGLVRSTAVDPEDLRCFVGGCGWEKTIGRLVLACKV
jgi:hypothetical protein